MLAANPTAPSAARQTSRPRSRYQTPIGPADRLSGLSRSDFLPLRFSDAGCRSACTAVPPASEKPAHKQPSWVVDVRLLYDQERMFDRCNFGV